MTYTKDDIFQRILIILQEQFDIEESAVHLSASLRDDLDIDSIDAVSLMIELKPLSQKKIALENFHQVKTVSDLVDAVYRFLEQENRTLS
jgi:acyl carrier protein